MAYVGAVNIVIGASSLGLQSELSKVQSSISKTMLDVNTSLKTSYAQADKLNREFAKGYGRLGSEIESVGRKMMIGISLPFIALEANSLRNYQTLDKLERGIIGIEGSTVLAKETFKDFVSAAKLPGLGFEQINNLYLKLRGVSVESQKAIRYVKAFGKAAALGGGGKEELGRIGVQLTQLLPKKKIETPDLKPILEAAPNLNAVLLKLYGGVDSETINKKLKELGQNNRDFVDSLVSEIEKLDGVSSGFNNSVENITDSWFLFTAEIGRASDEALGLTGKIESVSNSLGGMAIGLRESGSGTKQLVAGVIGVGVALPVMITGLGAVITFLGTPWKVGFQAATAAVVGLRNGVASVGAALAANPFFVAIGAIGALSFAVQKYSDSIDTTIDKEEVLKDVRVSASAAIVGETSKIERLVEIAKDENQTKKDRELAIGRINQINPKYLGNISLENVATQQTTKAIAVYISILEQKAQAQIISNRLAEIGIEKQKELTREYTTFELIQAGIISGGNSGLLGSRLADIKVGSLGRLSKEEQLLKGQMVKLKKGLGANIDDSVFNPLNSGGNANGTAEGAGSGNALAEKRLDLAKKMADEIKRLNADVILDDYERTLAASKAEFEIVTTNKKKEYEEVKKPLDSAYFEWYRLQEQKLSNDNLEAELTAYKKMLIEKQKIKGINKNGEFVGGNGNAFVDTPKLGEKSFGAMPNELPNSVTMALEAYKQLGGADMAFRIQAQESWADFGETLRNVAIDTTLNMSIIAGQMIAGTESIQAMSILLFDTISMALSEIARMQIALGVGQLIATGGTKGWKQLFGGVAAGVGAGIAKGASQRQQQKQNTQPIKLQSSISGDAINMVGQRSFNIRNYN